VRQINYSVPLDNNDKQYVTRVDYQVSANHTVFGRYIDTFERRLPTLSRTGNILTVRRRVRRQQAGARAVVGLRRHARARREHGATRSA
jgi:hypothetical protein